MGIENLQKLKEKSIQIILENQHPSGAFIASPRFPTYAYSWFRDGTYIAYALLVLGYREECRRFLDWGSRVVLRQKEKIHGLKEKIRTGVTPEPSEFLGARYTLDGEEDRSDWPNFQIDGFGSWLWLTAEYLAGEKGEFPEDWKQAALLLTEYLSLVWRLPNNDCWEEFPEKIHPATLACIAGGTQAMSPWMDDTHSGALIREIKEAIRKGKHFSGYYPKHLGSDLVDASLIWLSVPYGVVDPLEPGMVKTIQEIEKHLLIQGGVKRYSQDTYYGGGRWILLSGFLGWYYVRTGRKEEAATLRNWIAAQSLEDGSLPEQISDMVNDPSMIQPWIDRWGNVAAPLLWSHAMFLILHQELEIVA